MSPGKLCHICFLLTIYKRTVQGYMGEIPESEINKLKVNCGNSTTSDFILTFTGEITALYPTNYIDQCKSTVDKDAENRGIYHTLDIPYRDRHKCGVLESEEKDLWKVNIHVQFDKYLITDDDLDYVVSCNYGNLTEGGMAEGRVLPSFGGPMELSDEMQQINPIVLYLEDKWTNHITHAMIGQSVRLHVRRTFSTEDCPTLPNNLETCERTSRGNSPLRCDSLIQEPFRKCNEIVDPRAYLQDCQIYIDQLEESFPECAQDRKRQYICQLQEKYECECQDKSVIIDWLPSEECVHKNSMLYVERCEVSSRTGRETILENGCGDEQHMLKTWQFYSSSSRSTRTPYFHLRRLVEGDPITITCILHVCTDPYICEKDCSSPPEERSVPGTEQTITTGHLYLRKGSLSENATGANNVESASGTCHDALFTSANFPFFIAILVLGFVVLVLTVLIVWMICKLLKKDNGSVSRADLNRLLVYQRELSQASSGQSDPVPISYKAVSTPAPHAFTRPTMPIDCSSFMTPGTSMAIQPGDRFDHETTLDICPPLTGGLSSHVRFGFTGDDDDDDDDGEETCTKQIEMQAREGRLSGESSRGLL